MITPEFLAALREKALAATSGPMIIQRFDNEGGEIHYQIEMKDMTRKRTIYASVWDHKANAEYIAAANPKVILQMIEEIERLRKLIPNPDRPAPLPIDDKYFESRLPPKIGTSVCQHGTPTDEYCKICKDESRWKESP